MRKFLFALIALGIALSSPVASTRVFAEPIVELAAPRVIPSIMPEDTTVVPSSPTAAAGKTVKTPSKTVVSKKTRKSIHKKVIPIKVNYNRVSKLIEYGYYDEADRIIQSAISRNSKDIKALSLLAISLAKQSKLEPAQKLLCDLLKKYPNNSDLHYAQGVVYYQRTTSSNMYYRNNAQKYIEDSLKEFKKAIVLDKNNARAYNAAGVISLTQNKAKDANDYFQKALIADKNYSMAIDNLGTIDFANGKFSEAEKKFQRALSFNTQNTTAMYHLAQTAMRKEDYAKALCYLNNALAINTNSPAIYNLMGKAYVLQGNEAAAINSFKQSITVKPEFTLSYFDLADIYDKRGDGDFAIEQLKTALSISPDFNDAKLKIADISLIKGDYNQAVAFYVELVGIDGYDSIALNGLANAYYGQAQVASNKALLGSNKDLYRALSCIDKAISANKYAKKQSLELHLARLKLAKITNQPELTKVELNKTINSQCAGVLDAVTKGEAYLTLNDYQNAQKLFNDAIKLSQNADDDMSLSEIFMYHKQYSSAEKILQKILLVDAKNQEALSDLDYIQKSKKRASNYFSSAKKFIKSRNSASAIEYLSRSLAIEPNNAEAHLLLAQLFEKQKDKQKALSHYNAYLSLAPNAHNSRKIKNKIKHLENRL